MERFNTFVDNIIILIIQPLVGLLFALALAYFIWGMAQFILNADNPDGREKGRRALIWGIVGIFIMATVTSILYFMLNTFCPPVSGPSGGFFCR